VKEDLPFFEHVNNARNHPKMKALIAEFGYEGYGRFWALNEKIAETSGAFIDISKRINKLALANELDLDGAGLDKFLEFLSAPDIDLININNGKLTTDRITETYSKVMGKRKIQREKKAKGEKAEIVDENGIIDSENEKIVDENDTEESRREENREEEIPGGSVDPPDVVSKNPVCQEAIDLASLLLATHRKEYPDYLASKDKKTLPRWAEDIDKLIRIDKKAPENIRWVILWVKTPGNFWFHNIESGAKLRKQFERLYGQMTQTLASPAKKDAVNTFIPSAQETKKLIEIYQKDKKETANTCGSLKGEFKKKIRDNKMEAV
jgi:hypothetical protein